MTGRIWQVLIATVLGVALLVGLGAWQLQRLAWKEALIAERDSRLAAAPVSLDEALKEFDADRTVEFLKVEAKGTFQNDAELFVLTTQGGSPGFQVVTPLVSTEGVVVLVDRAGEGAQRLRRAELRAHFARDRQRLAQRFDGFATGSVGEPYTCLHFQVLRFEPACAELPDHAPFLFQMDLHSLHIT